MNVEYHSLKNWKAGQANGYYTPETDTIHLLKGDDLEIRTLYHERVHSERRNKRTFRLSKVIATPFFNLLFLTILLLSWFAFVFEQFLLLPCLGLLTVYLIAFVCHIYEEHKAQTISTERLKKVFE